jgi:putative peptidoglycan lipid II flippase
MSLIRSTTTIGGYTLISRVLGFVRDVTIASGIGASYLSDAFFIAFKLPNFLRRLFAEGAFNSAFVPMFAGMLAVEGKDRARVFASEAMSFLIVILLTVTGVFILAMPWLMYILAPGFADDAQKFHLTITLTQITMPYILFISLVSLLGGILNSNDKFAAVAATPVIMNLCLIAIPTMIESLTPNMAYGLAVAVMVSGVAQWLWLVYFCRKLGMLPKLLKPKLTPDVKKLLLLIAPAALGAGVAQINLLIDLIIASQFDAGVSYLYYADRINELPLAIIGIAVGTALLPLLSRQVREGKAEEALKSHHRAIELALFLSLPAAAALIVIAEPVITVMFQRGAFGAVETAATYKALMAFAAGLPAFILIKILTPGFYAHQDTKTPFKIALVGIAVNLAFNLILMVPFKHVGMAMATSIAGWVNVVLLTRALMKRGWLSAPPQVVKEIAKIAGVSALLAAALYTALPVLDEPMRQGEIIRFTAVFAFSVAGGALYFASAWALNVLGLQAGVKRALKRPKA